MMWAKAVADLRKMVIAEVDKRINRIFGFTATASSSSMGNEDAVQLSDNSDDGQRPVQRIEPWGVRSRPPSKIRGMWLRLGSSNVAFLGILPTKAYGPTDLDEGEVCIYSSGGSTVKLDKDGNIKVDAAAGKDVVVNAGSAKVARVGDKTVSHTHAFSLTANLLTGAVTGSITSAQPVIQEGADNFKA